MPVSVSEPTSTQPSMQTQGAGGALTTGAPGVLSRCVGSAARWLCGLVDDKPERAWRAWAAYLLAVWAVVFAVAAIGPATTTRYPEDTLYVLGVGHRLWEGYRPYVDFHLGHGPLPFVLVTLGVWLKGVSMEAVWVGQMTAIALLGSLSFWMYRQRLSVFWTFLLTLTATSILASPSPLGLRVWREFGYAMFYNKVAFVLFGMIALSVLVPLRRASARRRLAAAATEGVVLGLLTCTKLSFGLTALGLYVLGKLVWPQAESDRRRDFGLALVIMALVVWGTLAACGSSVTAYVQAVATFKKGWDAPVPLLLGRYLQYTDMIFYVGLLLLLTYGVGALGPGNGRKLLRNAVIGVAAAAGFLAVTATCCQDYNVVPLLGIVPLAAILSVRRCSPANADGSLGMAVAVVGTVLLLGAFVKDAALASTFMLKKPPTLLQSVLAARRGANPASSQPSPFEAGALATLRHVQIPEYNAEIMAALALLERHGCAMGDVLYVCAPVDAVTLFTQCRYPKGTRGVYAWHMVLTGPVQADLPTLYGDDFLSQTKWVLRYQSPEPIWDRLQPAQGQYLAAHFEAVGHDGPWTLYRRH